MPADELQHLLYEKSGLLGVSGFSVGLPGDNQTHDLPQKAANRRADLIVTR
jgi:acetate kinase